MLALVTRLPNGDMLVVQGYQPAWVLERAAEWDFQGFSENDGFLLKTSLSWILRLVISVGFLIAASLLVLF